MKNSQYFVTNKFSVNEKWLVFVLIGVYLLLAVIWQFKCNAPWDDDCIGRYYNSRDAIHNPLQFISLWNRPLFIILFFIPFQLSKYAILLMALITAVNAYTLYQVAKRLNVANAFLIIPMLVFQAFFFTISRSALTEPLAATIISLGYLFYLDKKFLYFALIGSLLPLARLELSVLLIIWAYILLINNKWKYIFLLTVPTILWSLAGTVLEGDMFWLYEKTIGKDNSTNRYGHTDFWHYFQRYIYVIGPIIFYFFIVGLTERLYKLKFNVFLIGQFILGFSLYVLFSWKLNMGQPAGFLRHLISLSPLAALISLHGYNYWVNSIGISKSVISDVALKKNDLVPKKSLESRIQEIQVKAKKENLKPKETRYLINAEKRTFNEEKNQIAEIKFEEERSFVRAKHTKVRMVVYSIVMMGLAYIFFSKKLIYHHKISDLNDYTNILVIGGISIAYLLLIIIFRNRKLGDTISSVITFLLIGGIVSYTLITEPPDSHDSPQRQTMESISDLYVKGYLKNYECYVNHPYFFWANEITREDEKFHVITKENLIQAPDSSIIIWENHYSTRLAGDVEIDFFKHKPEFIELFKKYSSDRKFMVVVAQKLKPNSPPDDIIKIYDRFIAFAPEIQTPYFNRGNVKFSKLRNYKEAIEDYNIAIAIDSTDINAYFNRGLCYSNSKKYTEAKSDFIKVVELKSDYYQGIFNIGVCMTNLKDYTNAIVKYTEVIKIKADYDQAYYNRAIAYANTGEFEKAILDYAKVTELKPNDSKSYYYMGASQIRLGKTNEACKSLQKAYELGNPNAGQLLKRYCK